MDLVDPFCAKYMLPSRRISKARMCLTSATHAIFFEFHADFFGVLASAVCLCWRCAHNALRFSISAGVTKGPRPLVLPRLRPGLRKPATLLLCSLRKSYLWDDRRPTTNAAQRGTAIISKRDACCSYQFTCRPPNCVSCLAVYGGSLRK